MFTLRVHHIAWKRKGSLILKYAKQVDQLVQKQVAEHTKSWNLFIEDTIGSWK